MSFNLRTFCEQQERHFCYYMISGQISFRILSAILYTVTTGLEEDIQTRAGTEKSWEDELQWSDDPGRGLG